MSIFKTDMKSRSFWDWLCGNENQVQLDAATKAYVPKDYETSASDVVAKIIYLNERDEKVDASIRFIAGVYDHFVYGTLINPGSYGFEKWMKKNAASGFVEIDGFDEKTKELIPLKRVLKIESKSIAVKLRYRK